jgi:siroheme synthase-like protein
MAYFPFMVDIEDKKCLVVGGGNIALHKVKILLNFDVNILVVAEQICPELKCIAEERKSSEVKNKACQSREPEGKAAVCQSREPEEKAAVCQSSKIENRLKLQERQFQQSDINHMDFVVAATDDEKLNTYISTLCKEKNIPINAVDMKEECSFIFPAMIQEKDLLIAISSGGQSPAAAAYVKRKIKGQLPEYYGDMVEQLGQYRDYVLDHVDTAAKRKEIFNRLLEYGDSHGGKIPMEKVIEVVERSGA